MKSITKQIEEILDQRLGRGDKYKGRGHVELVREHKNNLNAILDVLANYKALRQDILFQIENKTGDYYTMSIENPEFSYAVITASPEDSINEIQKAIDELEHLEQRFGRDTINISVVGRAGQGKSLLLQSISGLDDTIIPSAQGGDCTGAKSVICNQFGLEETYADVISYTEVELVEQIQLYLNELKIPVRIGSVSQIPSLVKYVEKFQEELESKSGRDRSLFKHLQKYVEHYDEYANMLGTVESVKKNEIREYVAQYDSNDNPTYKFLAVKEVRIFTEFTFSDAGKILLVDTIGLGDTALGIREKMFATLRNDSDAAILLRRPDENRDSIREEDDSLYDSICEAMGKEMLNKWLFLTLNVGAKLRNFKTGETLEKEFINRKLNFAGIKKVDCSNSEEVQNELLLPILEYLVENLKDVDESLLIKVNSSLQSAYVKYYDLCAKASSVLNGGLKTALEPGGLFDDLFESRLGLAMELNKLNQAYSNLDSESTEIRSEVQKVLRGIANNIPTLQDIKNRLSSGGPDAYVENVYNFYADNVRASIRDSLDAMNSNVISGIQDEVKIQIIDVLKSDEGGRMARIPLKSPNLNDPIQWLKSLIEEKTDGFEIIKTALNDICNFRLNIEGLLEYKANLALSCYDQMSPDFARLPEIAYRADVDTQAEIIRQTIVENVPVVANSLMGSIVELLRIPVNSFNSHIRKLRERIIFKQEGRRELKNFYRKTAPAIWPNEFATITSERAVINGWSDITKQLEDLRDRNRFIITL